MFKSHKKNSVRYYLLVVLFLAFLFLSNDFGMLDVQKTAIVMAVGIDREAEEFIVTSQIAVPQSSKQGKSSETVQLLSRGKTVAAAFEEINAKTGWYPKLVFCNLIILGKSAAEYDVFDALDFFLRDEYLSDNCLVATCDGFAKDLLNTTALVDPSGSVAMQKVLSPHSERVGTVLPSTLREFSIGYYSDSRSGFLPVIKTEPQQEHVSGSDSDSGGSGAESSGAEGSEGSDSGSGGESAGGSGSTSGSGQQKQDKPVFSAGETALFVGGKRVGTLTREETFAFGAVNGKLRLAAYSVEGEGKTCTLTIKRNTPKIELSMGENERAFLKIRVTVSAGLMDYSEALDIGKTGDVGDVPRGYFELAEKKLTAEIGRVFEKSRACGCDLFGVVERLEKYEKKHADALKDGALAGAIPDIAVTFRNIR